MWAFELPWALVEAHLEAIPRLRAEESLIAATRVALGSGTLKRADASAVHRAWSQQAHEGRRRVAPRPVPLPKKGSPDT